MEEENILIIAKGEDKTKEVEDYSICENGKVIIKFYNK